MQIKPCIVGKIRGKMMDIQTQIFYTFPIKTECLINNWISKR